MSFFKFEPFPGQGEIYGSVLLLDYFTNWLIMN